jgi:hypothetical protein
MSRRALSSWLMALVLVALICPAPHESLAAASAAAPAAALTPVAAPAGTEDLGAA